MTRRGLEIRVGFAIVLASVILIFGTMWFQKFKLVERRYNFFVRFPQVGGLSSDDPIVVNGVERGRVRNVALQTQQVVVELGIREGTRIPVDSEIVLKSIGIMGERFVAITQGYSQRAVEPGDTLDGRFLMGLSEVMGSAGAILDELSQVSRNLKEILDIVSAEGKLQTTMDNLERITGDLREITSENKPRLSNAIGDIENVASLLDTLASKHHASVDSSLASFGRAGGKLDSAVDDISQVATDLKEITTALRAGEGVLGKLLTDEAFADRLESTISGLDSLITDIKLHPGRYVSFSLF